VTAPRQLDDSTELLLKDGSFRGLGPGTPLAQLVVHSAGWTDEQPHHD
jgi:hypothetical protein